MAHQTGMFDPKYDDVRKEWRSAGGVAGRDWHRNERGIKEEDLRHWGCRNVNCKATVIAPHDEYVLATTTHGDARHTCKHAGAKPEDKRKLITPPDTYNVNWIELTKEEKQSDDWTKSFTLNDKGLKERKGQSTGKRIFGCRFCKATVTQTSDTPKGNLNKINVDDGIEHNCKKFANKTKIGRLPGPDKTFNKNYILITGRSKS